jgi:hypothetical protein
MFIEIDDKNLIRWIAGSDKCHCGGDNVGTLGTHASAAFNHQANRDWQIFVAEGFDWLRDFVFIDLKTFLAES